jgi:hypothetical protein
MTAVEFLKDFMWMKSSEYFLESDLVLAFDKALAMEKEQSELYAEFAVLNDRSGNPIIPFNEFINIDNL